ncbi:MAG: TOBE domain-containing protein, partial [Devosia sp.]|nr:TOBE domain-containing protein [Devosia sp.]
SAGGALVPTGVGARDLPVREGLVLGVRPDALRVVAGDGTFEGTVEIVERLGDRTLVHVRLADGALVIAEDIGKSALEPGDAVALLADRSETHVFDAEGVAYHST